MAKIISFEQAQGTTADGGLPKVPVFADRSTTQTTPEVPDDGQDFLTTFNDIATAYGTQITSGKRKPINYGAGAASAHVTGRAADFRTHGLSREQGDALIQDLKSRGFWVNDERDNWNTKNPKTGKQRGTGPHIHAEWRGDSLSSPLSGVEEPAMGAVDTSTGTKVISFEDAQGPVAAPARLPEPTTPDEPLKTSILDDAIDFVRGGTLWAAKSAIEAPEIAAKKFQEGWEFVRQRMQDKPDEFLGQKVEMRERTPDEIDRYLKDNPTAAPRGIHFSRESELNALREQLRFVPVVNEKGKPVPAAKEPGKGFWANVENPLKLLTEDSLPANIVETLANVPAEQGRKFIQARQVMQQEKILANPTKYSLAEVEQARQAVKERTDSQDLNIGRAWNDLRTAAKEDPGRFGATFANALIADPQMLLMPEGLGVRAVSTLKKVQQGSAAVAKAVQLGERVVDAASSNAALNLAIEGTAAASEGRELTAGEAKQSAILGAGIGGTLASLSAVFSKSASAIDNIRAGKVTADTLEQALRDVAADDVLTEQIVNDPTSLDSAVRERIEDQLGIRNLTDAEKKKWHSQRQRELKKVFEENSLEADYLGFKAEERITRRTQLAEEAVARRTAEEAEAAKQAEVDKAYAENQAQRTARFATEYEQALAARDEAVAKQSSDLFDREERLKQVTAELDEQEIIEAAFDGDVPAIKRAMNSAAKRDSQLTRPKWQRGEVDPKLLARLGASGLFAGTAFAAAPEDKKLAAAFTAGLAGLVVPGGGSVLRRMRQAGAISADGDLLSMARLVKEGKLKPVREAAETIVREQELVGKARQGDQAAWKELYEENVPKLERYMERFIKTSKRDLGVTSSDLAQEAFLKAFQNIDKFDDSSQFFTWLYTIGQREALQAIRRSGAQKRGAGFDIHSSDTMEVDDLFEDRPRDFFEEGAGADTLDTPENQKIRMESERIFANALNELPENTRLAVILNKIEGYELQDVAVKLGVSYENVRQMVSRGQDKLLNAVERGTQAKRVPMKERGEIDPKLLKTAAGVSIGGLVGGYIANEAGKDAEGNRIEKGEKGYTNPLFGAIAGAGTGALLFGAGGKGLKNIARGVDKIYGASSTRILNRSPAIHKRILSTERRILEQTHQHIKKVEPFLLKLEKMPKEGANVLARALMTGRGAVIDKILQAFGDAELSAGYKMVRQSLDSLGDQLVNLKRFSRGNIEYFPRIVKDKEGLFKAIGKQEASTIKQKLETANIDSLRKHGRPLGDIEESALINQMLFVEKRGVQPGFTKGRGIEEITPELQQYYASPAESLHSYIRAAVQDIEGAKFFGSYGRNMKRGNNEFLDVDRSVKNLIAEEVQSGKLSDEDAREVSDILRTRFKEGMRAENDTIRSIKNIGNIGLLGNFWSAATQMADVGIQVYTQGLRPTLESIVRQITKKKLVDMRDFGLADSISEEFAGQLKSNDWVRKAFKYSLFSKVDEFGKNTALNAAVIKGKMLAQTDSGQVKLANKYKEAFGDDFGSLVSDLKSGKISDLTRDYAFMELSKTQPISRIEMPEAYLKHPNWRSYLWLKSFTMKQVDLVRREAYNEIKKGGAANISKGVYNLTRLGVILGLSGATTNMVKDVMMGKDVEFKASDIPVNMFKAFGFSEYMRDQFSGVSREEAARRKEDGEAGAKATKAQPLQAIANNFMPPVRMYEQMLTGDPAAIRYIVPGMGPYLAEQVKKANQLQKDVSESAE